MSILLLLASSTAFATAHEVTERALELRDGRHEFVLTRYVNEMGAKEVQVEHVEIRRLLPDTRTIVLWGRDTDQDGKFDAWFYHGESGVIEGWDLRSHLPDGWDAAAPLLRHQVSVENRWLAGIVFGSILNSVTLRGSKQAEWWKQFARDQMTLRHLEIVANREFLRNRAAPGLTAKYEIIADGWEHLASKSVSAALKQNLTLAAADVGVYAAGALLVRGLGWGAGWAGKKVMGSAAGDLIHGLYARYLQGLVSQADHALKILGERTAAITGRLGNNVVAAGVRAARVSAVDEARLILAAIEARGKIGHFAARQLRGTFGVGKAMVKRLPYMGLVQSTQILAEVANRPDELFDPNPVMVDEFMQNLMFMSRETVMLATVSERDRNVRRRMIVCGVLAMGNSGMTTYMYNDGAIDKGRVALDTSWEVIIGNTQTQADIAALQYFEKLAERTSNPRFKVVGYALTLVEQGAGYYGYSKVTQWYEGEAEITKSEPEFKPSEIRWVTLVAPVTSSSTR